MNTITTTSMMPPRKDIELQPFLEKRRIIGSLRERTVYLQSPQNSQSHQLDDQEIDHQRSVIVEQIFDDLAKRVSNHIEKELSLQQFSISKRIDEIEGKTQRYFEIQENLENRLKKLRKKLKKKRQAHSQPIVPCRSGIALFKNDRHHFSSDDSSRYMDEMKMNWYRSLEMNYSPVVDDQTNLFFTTLW